MMTFHQWTQLTDLEKFDYLLRHCHATEQAMHRLSAQVQLLLERQRKFEVVPAENAA
jgi:hypothetical protein